MTKKFGILVGRLSRGIDAERRPETTISFSTLLECELYDCQVDAFLFPPLAPNKEHIVGTYIGVTVCFVFYLLVECMNE